MGITDSMSADDREVLAIAAAELYLGSDRDDLSRREIEVLERAVRLYNARTQDAFDVLDAEAG